MRTQYYTAASLDGFIATVDDSLEWLFPLGDVIETSYPEFIKGIGALAGSGKPLLPRPITSPSLRLVSVQQFGTGFAELRYEVPGAAPQR
jgi:hypothetical protein